MIRPPLHERQLVIQLQEELLSAKMFRIASAMVSVAGVNEIFPSLERCLEKGGSGRILIGVDLPSDPHAIERLRKLADEHSDNLKLRYFRPLSGSRVGPTAAGRSLIAPGQRQTCSRATTDTSTAAIIFSNGCASRTASPSHERGMQGMQLLRPAQGRPNGQGRPFYNRLRQRGATSIPVRNASIRQ
jgi:hypothetical protein